MAINKQQVRMALTHVMHPEMEQDIVSLDMVEDIIIQDKFVSFTIDLPEKNPKLDTKLKEKCEEAILKYVDEDAVLDNGCKHLKVSR